MKAITVKQPWASAIASGHKRVENRTRPSPWRSAVGEVIAIHAGKGFDRHASDDPRMMHLWQYDTAQRNDGMVYGMLLAAYFFPQSYPAGVVIATARLTDVHTCDGACSPWADPGQWHLALDEITVLPEPFVAAKGALGLWTAPALEMAA